MVGARVAMRVSKQPPIIGTDEPVQPIAQLLTEANDLMADAPWIEDDDDCDYRVNEFSATMPMSSWRQSGIVCK